MKRRCVSLGKQCLPLSPPVAWAAVCSKAVVLLLLTFCLLLLPLWESVVVLCFVVRYFMSIAIILMGKRELIALLNLSSWCLVMVERLFLAVPWGCLQFVIVVFPDHTHLLFLSHKVKCQFSRATFSSTAIQPPFDTTPPDHWATL